MCTVQRWHGVKIGNSRTCQEPTSSSGDGLPCGRSSMATSVASMSGGRGCPVTEKSNGVAGPQAAAGAAWMTCPKNWNQDRQERCASSGRGLLSHRPAERAPWMTDSYDAPVPSLDGRRAGAGVTGGSSSRQLPGDTQGASRALPHRRFRNARPAASFGIAGAEIGWPQCARAPEMAPIPGSSQS